MAILSASRIVLALSLLAPLAAAAPAASTSPSSTVSAPEPTVTFPYASDDPNEPSWSQDADITPEAIRGELGATVLGPQNKWIDIQNPDLLAPPTTDHGSV